MKKRRKYTEETKRKMSEAQKKRFKTKESCPMYGKHHSEETKRKIGLKSREKVFSQETRMKMSLSHLGKKRVAHSEETKEKLRQKAKEQFKNGFPIETRKKLSIRLSGTGNPMYNKNHSKETKTKIGKKSRGRIWPIESRLRMSKKQKENVKKGIHNFWKGGISNSPYSEDWNGILRELIRQRDSYTCQLCGTHQNELVSFLKKLDVHHIDYDKQNCDFDNLITLCRGCHVKTNKDREFWIDYFREGVTSVLYEKVNS